MLDKATNTKTSTGSAAKTDNFASRVAAAQAKENAWQNFSGQANYYVADMVKSLQELAHNIFPENDFNAKAYQEAILNSLSQTISPEIGVKDFWVKLSEKNCKSLNITDGHLNFFDSENNKIDITSFTQPIVFEAHSSFYKERQKERLQKITDAKRQLATLRAEIYKK